MTMANETRRLYLPALRGLYDALAGLSYPIMRFFVGIMLVPHGAQKLFGWFGGGGIEGTTALFAKLGYGMPGLVALWIGFVEFFLGLFVAVGFLTRLAAIIVAIELAVAAFTVHLPNHYFWSKGGYEYPLMWCIMAFAIAIRGAGRYSVDGLIGKEL